MSRLLDDPRVQAEIFAQKTPCQECPFRRDSTVTYAPGEVITYASYFVSFPGATFPCHKSVPKSDDRSQWSPWQDGQVLCAGGLIFAVKNRRFNLVMLEGLRQGWWHPNQYSDEAKARVFDSLREALVKMEGEDGQE